MSHQTPDHRPVIVAGLGRLGLRIVQLLRDGGTPVRVITDSSVQPWHLRQAREAGAEVFTGDFRDPDAWAVAGAEECQAAIVTSADDSRNLETSIRVKRLAPALRMVTRVDAPHLGHRLQRDFELHAALCPAALSAAHFVKCALEAPEQTDAPPARRPVVMPRRTSWQMLVLEVFTIILYPFTVMLHGVLGSITIQEKAPHTPG